MCPSTNIAHFLQRESELIARNGFENENTAHTTNLDVQWMSFVGIKKTQAGLEPTTSDFAHQMLQQMVFRD